MKSPSTSVALLMGPAANIVNLALNLVTIMVALRIGQAGAIAGFSAGSTAVILIAVVCGGGTTLAYATGSRVIKGAVARLRYRLILPTLLVASVLAAAAYASVSSIAFLYLLYGGIFAALSNITELQISRLQSEMRTDYILYSSLASRILGLLAVLGGVNFALAMTLVSLSHFVMLSLCPSAPVSYPRISLTRAARIAYRPSLISITLSDALLGRAPLLVAPLIISSTASADAFATIFSAATAVQAIAVAALYTLMNVHSSSGARPPWAGRLEAVSLLGAILSTVLALAVTPVVGSFVGLDAAQGWWIASILSLPFATFNRKRQYALMAIKRHREAARIIGVAATLLSGLSLLSALISSPLLLAASGTIGHIVAAAAIERLSRSTQLTRR